MPGSSRQGNYLESGKRLTDIVAAISLLIILSPLLALVALMVRLRLGSPVIFRQPRPGRNGAVFTLYKFRTMTDERTPNGELLSDAARLTRFGIWLRITSLDELPELWNIVRGDMSFVGPRPLLTQYLERYTPEQARRHEVRPGLTGWAQVHGRNALDWESKFSLDVWYVDHCSLTLDLWILALTVIKVIRHDGISAAGQATVEEFRGSCNPAQIQSRAA